MLCPSLHDSAVSLLRAHVASQAIADSPNRGLFCAPITRSAPIVRMSRMAFYLHRLLDAATSQEAATPATPGAAIAFAVLTGVGMLVGVWAIRRYESKALLHTGELIAFAAGLLIAGALLHLIERAVELVGPGRGLAWTLVGFLALYVVEAHFIPHVHARGDSHTEGDPHAPGPSHLGPLVIAGLAVHSIADGVSVGAALSAGALIGSVALLLVVAHKLPVGMAAMTALYHSGVPGNRALLLSGALASVTPIAVLISYFAFRGVSEDLLGILLALAGGSFLYVGAADLLPEGQATGKPVNTALFFVGAFFIAILKLWTH